MARGVQTGRKAPAAAQAAQRAIALELAPLVAPYKKEGRLSLRVENLPQGARLSHGSRNNERSWSLASDELEGLSYLLPDGQTRPHKLALRIVGLANGNTLAVIEIDVDPSATHAGAAPAAPAVGETPDDGELAKLREALTQAETELGELRGLLAQPAPRDASSELAAARESWTKELDARLAEAAAARDALVADLGAKAKTELAAARAAWQKETADALTRAQTEANTKRDGAHETKLKELTGEIASLKAAVTKAKEEAAAADAAWQTKLAAETAATAKTRDEAARAAEAKIASLTADHSKAEARWKDELAKAVAEARQSVPAPVKDEAALAALRAQVAALEVERDTIRRDGADALAKAEASWKAAEEERTRTAEARAKDALEKAVAEATTAKATTANQADVELAQLRAKIAALEVERDAARREGAEAVAKAEAAWKTAEAERTRSAEARAQEALAKAVAEAQASVPPPPPPPPSNDAALNDLRTKVAALEAERDAARREGAEALAKAQSQWQAAMAKAVAEAKSDAPPPTDGNEATELRARVAELQSQLDERNEALVQARREVKNDEHAQREVVELRAKIERLEADAQTPTHRPDPQGAGHASRVRERYAQPADNAGLAKKRTLQYAAGAAAALLIGAIVYFYPEISSLWGSPPAAEPTMQTATVDAPAPEAPAPEPKIVVIKEAKLRKQPAVTAPIIAKLDKGDELVVLSTWGKWTKARLPAKPGDEPKEGWVTTSLTEPAATADPKPAK